MSWSREPSGFNHGEAQKNEMGFASISAALCDAVQKAKESKKRKEVKPTKKVLDAVKALCNVLPPGEERCATDVLHELEAMGVQKHQARRAARYVGVEIKRHGYGRGGYSTWRRLD